MLRKITHSQLSQHVTKKNSLLKNNLFKPGEIVKGTVLRKLPGGEVLVSAKGTQFKAFSSLNLMEGNQHFFKIKTMGSRLQLKVMDGLVEKLDSPIKLWASKRVERSKLSGILTELSKFQNLKGLTNSSIKAFQNLQQLLPTIIFHDKGVDNPIWLSNFLNGSGLFWENKILRYFLGDKTKSMNRIMASDLKGILLSLEKSLASGNNDANNIGSLLSKIRQALVLIEQEQLLNLSSVRDGIGWLWYIPGSEQDGFKNGELFIQKKGDDPETRFSLFLEFTHLGQILVNIVMMNDVLTISFQVEDQNKAEFLNEHLPVLTNALRDLGMSTGTITCDVKEGVEFDFNPFPNKAGDSPSVHIVI